MGQRGSSINGKYSNYILKKETIIVILVASVILVSGNLFEQSFEHSPNPNILYGSDGGRHLISINQVTGAGTVIAPMSPVPQGRGFVALTFDSLSPEKLWAGQGSGNSDIYNVDITTGTTTRVGNAGLGSTAVNAFENGPGPSCNLYAVLDRTTSSASNHLVTISKSSGGAALVGSLGMTGIDAIAFKSDGKLFGVSNVFAKKGATTKIHEINPSTGAILSTKSVTFTGSNTASPTGGILSIEFDQNDVLYAGTGKAASGPSSDGGFLGTIDLSTGKFSPKSIAATTGSSLEALASFVADNFPPTITLNGQNPIFMQRTKQFADPGATSFDCHDGSQNVLGVQSGLNRDVVGQYSVPYTAIDSTGKQSLPTSRTVNVIDFVFYTPYEINPPEIVAEGSVVKSTFEIQDATKSGSITARIYSTSDSTGFSITLIQDGTSNRFVNSNIVLTETSSVPGSLQLKAVSGDRIFLEYEGVTSNPPAVAGSSPTGFGSPPPSTDAIRFDSDAFPPEASTNIFVTLNPPPATFPATVTVNLRDDDGAGTDLSLTTLTRIGTTNTYQTVLPVILSTQSGTNSAGTSTVNPILRVDVGDEIFATSPSVSSFEARAVILSPPPAVAFETPTIEVNYGTNTNCSTLSLSDPDNDGICSGSGGWETGSTALKIFLTPAERFNANAHYKYETTEAGAPANKCPRLLNIPSNPVNRADNPFTCPHPSKKDIFVEIDYMVNHSPDVNALMDVINAFKARNINLHILVDEQYTSSGVPLHEASTSWASFQVLSTQFFGTADERALSDAVDKLTKKRQLFHYNGWIHATLENPNSSGRSEIGGNEFVVSMGNFDRRVGTQDQQSGTFMHELLHNLNVRHGGNDDINCKPNYASVINYAHQFPLESGGILSKTLGQWKLDISGVALSTIDENSLSETANSMTGTDSQRSPIYTTIGVGGTPTVVTTGGQTNWNQVGGITSGTYAQNVRHVGISGCNPTDPDQYIPPSDSTLVLTGYNDLALIKPNFRVFGSFADGLSTVPHVDGDTFVPVDPSVLAAATSDPFVALPSLSFEINEGDDITAIPLARVIDYDSVDVDVDVDWGDGSPSEMLNDVTVGGTDPDVDLSGTHAYGDNGSYDIGLTVTNDRDGLVEESIGITVNNVAPSIGTVTVLPSTNVSPGESVTVSAEFTDPGFLDTHEGSTIDWGDGTLSGVGTGLTLVEPSSPGSVSASHAYSSGGTYTVTITVLDDDGGSASTSVEITVEGLILGNFISPIDNSQYNPNRTLPVKIPVTSTTGAIVSNANVFVFLDGAPATSKSESGNQMTFNAAGGFYDYGLAFPKNISSGPHTIKVVLAGAEPEFREVTITVS